MRGTLLYSGGCRFCRWVIRSIILRLDVWGQLDIIPFRQPQATKFLYYTGEEWNKTWWFHSPTGQLNRGDEGGGVALLRFLYLTKPLGYVLWGLRLNRMVDGVDKWVKHHRPQLAPWVKDGPAIMRIKGEYHDVEKV